MHIYYKNKTRTLYGKYDNWFDTFIPITNNGYNISHLTCVTDTVYVCAYTQQLEVRTSWLMYCS